MNKRIYNTGGAITLFILSPILALPIVLLGIYERKYSAFVLFAIFLGLIAYLTLPFADLYRHTLHYYSYGSMPDKNFSVDAEWFIPIIDRFLYQQNIRFEFLRFFEATIGFLQLNTVLQWLISTSPKTYSKKEAFTRFIILFLFFEFLYMITGMRFGFAMCQYVFGLHLLLNRKKYLLSLVFFFLSWSIHVSFAFFIPITFLIYLIKPSRKNIIFILLFSAIIYGTVSEILLPLMDRRSDWYFSEDSTSWGNTTFYGFVFSLVPKLCAIPFILLLLKFYDKKDNWNRIALSWLILTIILIEFFVPLQRCTWIFNLLGVFLLIRAEAERRIKPILLKSIILCGVILTFANGVNQKTIMLNSDYYRISYPLPIILTQEYELEWILRNIDNNTLKEL